MAEMEFGKLRIDPEKNPAVLDTCTWDLPFVQRRISEEFFSFLTENYRNDTPVPYSGSIRYSGMNIYPLTSSKSDNSWYFICELEDRQHVFIAYNSDKIVDCVGEALFQNKQNGAIYKIYPVTADTVHNYCRGIDANRGPVALGYRPRLGIGTRMSTLMWPSIYKTLYSNNRTANTIQNSLRELRLLSEIKNGEEPRKIHLHSFGTIFEGHTGSTFEGLLLQGVLSALKSVNVRSYGADADHIKVKNTPDGVKRAKKIIDAAKYYSFYTVDISPILRYEYLFPEFKGRGKDIIHKTILNNSMIEEVRGYHTGTFNFGSDSVTITCDTVERIAGKYWTALHVLEELSDYIGKIKEGIDFDLELSIDEAPEQTDVKEILTIPEEVVFLCREFERRRLPVTHLAPNFGVEKGVDYRMSDGLDGLESKVGLFYNISKSFGIMLDCHSGDDLSADTRNRFRRATNSNIHYKISPILQETFAEILYKHEPVVFHKWWEHTLDYVRAQSENGMEFAKHCIAELNSERGMSPKDTFFKYYHYASVGRLNESGQYLLRDEFYNLSPEIVQKYEQSIDECITMYCEDLFN